MRSPQVTNPVVTVFGSSTTPLDDEWYQAAVKLGGLLVAAGWDVATGGYGGTMEAVSKGAHEGGGRVIGVTVPALFPHRTGANQYVTDEMPEPTLTERIHRLIDISSAMIALPGALGTATELMVAWNLVAVLGHDAPPVVAVGDVWHDLLNHIGGVVGYDPSNVIYVNDIESVVTVIESKLSVGDN